MKNIKIVAIYSLAHFIVDMSCAMLLFRFITIGGDWYIPLLVYNFCAFAMQLPIGIIADILSLKNNSIFAVGGCILIIIGSFFSAIPMLSAIIIGLGNGAFHIGGGIDVINISNNKATRLGIFVATGAFGIYLGTILGKATSITILVALILLCIIILIILCNIKKENTADKNNSQLRLEINYTNILSTLCLFIVVCLRSYIGILIKFPWNTSKTAVILITGIVVGKAMGGYLADKYGAIKTTIISLSLSSILFLFSNNIVCGTIAIFLFNMTMPITLWALVEIFPNARGFSFGLLTLALFVGIALYYLGLYGFGEGWIYALGTIISIAFIVPALLRQEKKNA